MRHTAAEMMDIVLASLVVELRADGTEEVCAAALYPGDGAPLDYAECGGMAWVRLITAAPSTSFPAPNGSVDNCALTLAYNLEVAVMRPAPIPEQFAGGVPDLPTDAEHTAATHAQLADMEAMYRAFKRAAKDIEMTLVGSYTPVGPIGGTVGGSWTISVGNE
jgi:hypothetical protein